MAAWEGIAGRLAAQVVHADLAASNVLVSPDTGAVTGVLDFEMAGYWIRAQVEAQPATRKSVRS